MRVTERGAGGNVTDNSRSLASGMQGLGSVGGAQRICVAAWVTAQQSPPAWRENNGAFCFRP